MSSTLIDIMTIKTRSINLKTFFANTSVRTHGINTLPVLTKIRYSFTFIYILSIHGKTAIQAQLLILRRISRRAYFAARTPRFAHGTATIGFGDPFELPITRTASSMSQMTETVLFSFINASFFVCRRFKTFETFATERSLEVVANSVLAQVLICCTFVDVDAIVCSFDL